MKVIDEAKANLQLAILRANDAGDVLTRTVALDEICAWAGALAQLEADPDLAAMASGSPYIERGKHKWLHDVMRRDLTNDTTAEARLRLHQRASTTATFNGLVPPAFIGTESSTASRPARQTADALGKIVLPAYGNTVQLPRPSSGVTVDAQTAQNVNPTGVDPVFLADQSVTLAALEGQVDVSRQTVERGDAEKWLVREVRAAYDRRVGQQVIAGTGAAGQALGLVNQPGLASIAYTSGTPTTALLCSAIAGAAAGIATATGCNYGDVVVAMHPRRYAAIMRDTAGLGDDPGLQAAVGLLVVTDPNVRINLGVGTNEDEVFAFDPAQVGLIESPYRQWNFTEPLGPATVRLAAWGYVQVLNRLPGAIARISGTGLVTPTF